MTDLQGQGVQPQEQNPNPQAPVQAGANPFNVVGATPVEQVPTQVPTAAPIPNQQTPTAVAPQEGMADKIINGIIGFIAKLSGQADPRTGQGAVAPAPAAPVAPVPQAVQQPVAAAVSIPEPVVEVPVPAAPVVEVPVVETPVVEVPVVETPVIETPVVAPVVEAPVVEAPVVEAPVVEAPVIETQVIETQEEALVEEEKPTEPATAENTTETINPNQ